MARFSDYIVFVDESGDHGMTSIDPHYPVFVLAFCIFAKDEYARHVAPAVLRFKFEHFGHDQVILHEREIRKSLPPFAFLVDAARRERFLGGLNELVGAAPFTLVASAIRKERYRERHGLPANPYHVAMGFGLERVCRHLQGLGCRGGVAHLLFAAQPCLRRDPPQVPPQPRRAGEWMGAEGLPLMPKSERPRLSPGPDADREFPVHFVR